jgi:hypothetical protein
MAELQCLRRLDLWTPLHSSLGHDSLTSLRIHYSIDWALVPVVSCSARPVCFPATERSPHAAVIADFVLPWRPHTINELGVGQITIINNVSKIDYDLAWFEIKSIADLGNFVPRGVQA